MLGAFDGKGISLSEVNRFESRPVYLPDGLHTDVLHIWSEIKKGLAVALRETGGALDGIGVDTWGVDFALLDRQGALLSNPYHYRDTRTDGILVKAFEVVDRAELFEQTGLQFMPINTLYQLYALKLRGSPLLDYADTLLMMPDLFNYLLTGKKVTEFTIATTTQCFDPRKNRWAYPLMERFGLSAGLFRPIVTPGTVLGELLPQVGKETGCTNQVRVIAPGCHDSALAVAAVPAETENFAYISCGTWSLLGTEVKKPHMNPEVLKADFTNEGGVAGTYRLQKNLTGLWLVQECRRAWAAEGEECTYAQLTGMAADVEPLRSHIDPEASGFMQPGDMPHRIREFCRKTGQKVPESKGAVVRCIVESLALSYRRALEQLETILGRRLPVIHIVGGGTRNTLLCRCAADATGRRVVAGPVEATAIGNVIMQAVALGDIGSLSEARGIVRSSSETATYLPEHPDQWGEVYATFRNLGGD